MIAIVVALPVLAGAVAWLVETDEEAIERITNECRRAFLAGEVEAVTARLTEDAEGEGSIGSGPLAPRVRHWADQVNGRVEDDSSSLREIVVEGDEARATWAVRLRLKGSDRGPFGEVRFLLRLEYHRVSDEWRIHRAEAVRWSL